MSKDNDYINWMLEKYHISKKLCSFVTLHPDGSLTLHTDPESLQLPCFDKEHWATVGTFLKPVIYRWKHHSGASLWQ